MWPRPSLSQQGAVAAHPALQQQDDCQEEEPRKEQEGPRPRRARSVSTKAFVALSSVESKDVCLSSSGTSTEGSQGMESSSGRDNGVLVLPASFYHGTLEPPSNKSSVDLESVLWF